VTYYYKITAVDRGNSGNGLYSIALESGYSNTASTVARINPPALVSADCFGSNVNLVWTDSSDRGAGNFSSYKIYRSVVSGGPYTPVGSSIETSYSDTPSTVAIYYYVMTSSDRDGVESIYSNETMASPDSIPPTVVHTPITEIDVLGGYAIIAVTITDKDNTGSPGTVVSAKLYYEKTGGSWIAVSTTTNTGDLYTFKIGPIDATFMAGFKYYIEAKDLMPNNSGYFVVNGTTITAENAPTVDVKTQTAETVVPAASGGTITVPDGDQNTSAGHTSIVIPPGALSTNVPISIVQHGYPDDTAPPPWAFKNENTSTIASNSTAPVSCFDFLPNNTEFKKPVLLTIRYLDQNQDGIIDDSGNISALGLRLYWWDNWGWRYVDSTVDTAKNTVSGYVNHFTLYALFPKGTPPVKPATKDKFLTPATNNRIQFECDSAIKKIEIYDVTGKKIRTIDDGSDNWDGKDDDGNVLESGVYIYKVEAVSGQKRTGAVVLAK